MTLEIAYSTFVQDYRVVEPAPSGKQFFRILHDWENSESEHRSAVPEVYTLSEDNIVFTESMQQLSYDLFCWGAPSLPYEYVNSRWTSIYDTAKAFTNSTGFGEVDPFRKNYITGQNVGNPNAVDPELDKHRFCGGFTGLGEIERDYRYWNYWKKEYQTRDVVWFDAIDPANLPTLDELIQTPWLYFHATIARKARADRFPNGVWVELDIYEPTLVPFFATQPVCWALDWCQPVPAIADPYKFGYQPY